MAPMLPLSLPSLYPGGRHLLGCWGRIELATYGLLPLLHLRLSHGTCPGIVLGVFCSAPAPLCPVLVTRRGLPPSVPPPAKKDMQQGILGIGCPASYCGPLQPHLLEADERCGLCQILSSFLRYAIVAHMEMRQRSRFCDNASARATSSPMQHSLRSRQVSIGRPTVAASTAAASCPMPTLRRVRLSSPCSHGDAVSCLTTEVENGSTRSSSAPSSASSATIALLLAFLR